MTILDDRTRARLRTPPPHASIDQSLVSRTLEPFWSWVADLVPPWVSPNAITLSGLLLVALAFAAMTALCPGFHGLAPGAVYVAAITALFAFQTLDAVDGKQARKTKSSSALGSWLDHVCDVVAIQLAMATVAATMDLGTGGLALFLMGSVVFNNYVIHWETKHTGTLFMGNGTSIYEAQLTLMVVHAVTLVVGQGLWRMPLAAGVTIADVVVVVGVGAIGGVGVIGSLRRVRTEARERGERYGAHLLELVPVTVLCASAAVAHAFGAAGRVPLTFAASLLGLRLIGHVILEHLADLTPKRFDATLVPMAGSAVVLAFFPRIDAALVGWANLAFAVLASGRFLVGATFEIARALGIPILTLPASQLAVAPRPVAKGEKV